MTISTNLAAFLKAIRVGEGTSDERGYYRLCGGGDMESLDCHPAYLGWKIKIPRLHLTSTAAGAYQINRPTWESLGNNSLSPFTPDMQDLAAIRLIERYKALEDVEAGRIASAVAKCCRCWASLPGAGYGQREEALPVVVAEFERHGGISS